MAKKQCFLQEPSLSQATQRRADKAAEPEIRAVVVNAVARRGGATRASPMGGCRFGHTPTAETRVCFSRRRDARRAQSSTQRWVISSRLRRTGGTPASRMPARATSR